MSSPIPLSRIFALAWPLVINGMVFSSAMVIDTVLISPLGETALAAVGLASAIAGLILGIMFAFGNGTQILIAQSFGARDKESQQSNYIIGTLSMGLIAIVGFVIIFLAGDFIIQALAETEAIATRAREYLHIFCFVIAGRAVSQPIVAYYNGCGDTRVPMYSNLLELPFNAILSYVLIYGIGIFPEMGVRGAAIGSVAASWLKVAVLSFAMIKSNGFIYRDLHKVTADLGARYRIYLDQALPIAVTFVSMTMCRNLTLLLYAKLGVNSFAALSLILPWVMLLGTMAISWATAIGILTGQLLGSDISRDQMRSFLGRAWRSIYWISGVISVGYLALSLAFPIVYGNLEAETLSALWSFVPILLVLPFLRNSNAVCGHVLRAGGDSKYQMKIHLVVQWLFTFPLNVLFILVFNFSATWVFAIFLFDEMVKFLPFHLRMKKEQWMKKLIK